MEKCWNLPKKIPKDKGEATARWQEGCNRNSIKSKTCQVVTHKLENNYTTEVLPPEWMFWAPHWASQPEGAATGGGVLRESSFEGQQDLTAGLPQDWGKQNLYSWRAHKVSCIPGPRGKKQWPHKRLVQTYLLVLEGLLQRWGVAVAHCRDQDTGSRSSGKYSLVWALPKATISPTKQPVCSSAGLPQAKQPTRREPSPTHQQTSGIKFYWAWPCPTRGTRPSSIYHQSLPSGSLHKPLRQPHHQRTDSRSKKNYNLAAWGKKTTIRES